MGIGPSYRSRSSLRPRLPRPVAPNPDPLKFKLIRVQERNGYLIVELQYEGCTTYEGRKLLVFKGVTQVELVNQALDVGIDPHFSDDDRYHHPVARFRPDAAGWQMAVSVTNLTHSPAIKH